MSLSKPQPKAGADEILAAAKDLFAARGFDAVSINDIAKQAGSSKANIFHHFGSKEDLHLAVMHDACRRSEALLSGMLREQGDAGARIAEYARQHLAMLYEDPERTRLVLREVLQSSPRSGQTLAERAFKNDFEMVTRVFREAQQAGHLAAHIDPCFAAFLMLAVNVMLFQSRHVLRHLPGVSFVDEPERYHEMLLDALLNGIGARRERSGQPGAAASAQSSDNVKDAG